MSLCSKLLGWGEIDVMFLERLIDEYEIDTDNVVYTIDELGLDKTDINSYIYAALYEIAHTIKMNLVDWLGRNRDLLEKLEEELGKDIIDEIYNYDEGIYANCIDSGFDSCFGEFDLNSATDDDYKELLKCILNYDWEEKNESK
jgi:hypothetical protein